MYLLQIESDMIMPVLIISVIINLIILYLIIKGAVTIAVKDGTKELLAQNHDLNNQLRLLNQLKVTEMKKNGVTKEEIQQAIDIVYPPHHAHDAAIHEAHAAQ